MITFDHTHTFTHPHGPALYTYAHSYTHTDLHIYTYTLVHTHTDTRSRLCFALFGSLHIYDCLQTDTGAVQGLYLAGISTLCHVRCCYFPRSVVSLFVLVLCAFTVQLPPFLLIFHCLLLDVFLLPVTANRFQRNMLIHTAVRSSTGWSWLLEPEGPLGGSQPWLAQGTGICGEEGVVGMAGAGAGQWSAWLLGGFVPKKG